MSAPGRKRTLSEGEDIGYKFAFGVGVSRPIVWVALRQYSLKLGVFSGERRVVAERVAEGRVAVPGPAAAWDGVDQLSPRTSVSEDSVIRHARPCCMLVSKTCQRARDRLNV